MSARDPDAAFRGPFSESASAVEHMRAALLLGDSEPEVRVGEPLVGGNRAAVEWWGTVKVEGEPHSVRPGFASTTTA